MAVHSPAVTVSRVVCLVLCLCAVSDAECPAVCSCEPAQLHDDADADAGGARRRGVAVTCSDVRLTSMPAELPPNAVSLDVSVNRLERLDGASLPQSAGVDTLSTANFSRNRIMTIATESFSEWSSLVSVDLSANLLSSIDHGTFRGAAQTALQLSLIHI